MDSSSVCVRKQGKRWWRKTQRKSLLTLLIKTPLLIGSISSQFSGENSFKEVGKTGSKSTRNLNRNSPQMPHFIESGKLAVGVCQTCRSTARSTGQRTYFRPLCHRSTGRSTETRYREQTLCPVDRPVDRGLSREQSSLDGRPGWSTGHLPELACTSVHVGRPARSTG